MVFENVPRKLIIVNSTPHPKDVIDEIRKCYASLLIFVKGPIIVELFLITQNTTTLLYSREVFTRKEMLP